MVKNDFGENKKQTVIFCRLLKKYIAFVIYAPAYNSSQLPLTLKSTPAGINTLPPFLRL